MDILGAGGIASLIGKVADKIWPDPLERAKNQLALAQLTQAGEFKEIDADLARSAQQTDINKVEAASESIFVSGWRPFIGWTCGVACAWNWIGLSVVTTIAVALGHPLVLTAASITEMLPVLLGMLGLGGLRTYEKVTGVAGNKK